MSATLRPNAAASSAAEVPAAPEPTTQISTDKFCAALALPLRTMLVSVRSSLGSIDMKVPPGFHYC